MNPQKELLWGLWVSCIGNTSLCCSHEFSIIADQASGTRKVPCSRFSPSLRRSTELPERHSAEARCSTNAIAM